MSFKVAGAASRYRNPLLEQIIGSQMQNYYRAQDRDKRRAETSQAISSIYGDSGLTDDQAKAAAAMAGAGMPLSGQMMEQLLTQRMVQEGIYKLPPAIRQAVRGMPFAEQREVITGMNMQKIQKIQKEKAYEAFVAFDEQMPKQKDSKLIDWGSVTRPQAAQYINLWGAITPEGMSTEAFKAITNKAFFGKFVNPAKPGKIVKGPGLDVDDKKILGMLTAEKYKDYADISDQLRFMLRRGDYGPPVVNTEQWNEMWERGIYDESTITTVENNVRTAFMEQLPFRYTLGGGPLQLLVEWKSGNIPEREEWIIPLLEATFEPGTFNVLQDVVLGRAEKLTKAVKMFNASMELKGRGLDTQRVINALFKISPNGWNAEMEDYITNTLGRPYSDVEDFKKLYQGIMTNDYSYLEAQRKESAKAPPIKPEPDSRRQYNPFLQVGTGGGQ